MQEEGGDDIDIEAHQMYLKQMGKEMDEASLEGMSQ